MRYWAAYRHAFAAPDWAMNLLLLCVCQLIPVLGPLVVMGYLAEDFQRVLAYPDAVPARFRFDRFMDYLKLGVWPFLVGLVAGFAFVPFFYASFLPLLAIPLLDLRDAAIVVPIFITGVLMLAMPVLLNLLYTSIHLRAVVMQEFAGAFNLRFLREFLGRMWFEMLLLQLFLVATAVPLTILGLLCCYVGLFPAMTIVMLAAWHLQAQLYTLYLKRGGTPIPNRLPPPTLGEPGPAFEVQPRG